MGRRQVVRRWRHRWQVVRFTPRGALTVCCSHRWAFTADRCADWRDFRALLRRQHDVWFEARETPERVR